MALQTLSCPILWPGNAWADVNGLPTLGTWQTLTSAGTHYVAMVFCAREAMTVSHVGWRSGAVAGSPTADTRIETVDTGGMPSGTLWATNTNIVSGTIAATTWVAHALTAPASIAAGQMVAVKILLNTGTSMIVQSIGATRHQSQNPYAVTNVSGSAVRSVLNAITFNIALGSSSTTFYSVPFTYAVGATATSNAFNNTSSAARGVRFQVPFKCRCVGMKVFVNANVGNFDYMIVTGDSSGTEVGSSSTSFDGNHSPESTVNALNLYFDTAVELTPATDYRAIIVPNTATNVSICTWTPISADYFSAMPGGTNFAYTTRTSGTWTNSTTQQPLIELIIDQLDDGASVGGSGGVSRSRVQLGH